MTSLVGGKVVEEVEDGLEFINSVCAINVSFDSIENAVVAA